MLFNFRSQFPEFFPFWYGSGFLVSFDPVGPKVFIELRLVLVILLQVTGGKLLGVYGFAEQAHIKQWLNFLRPRRARYLIPAPHARSAGWSGFVWRCPAGASGRTYRPRSQTARPASAGRHFYLSPYWRKRLRRSRRRCRRNRSIHRRGPAAPARCPALFPAGLWFCRKVRPSLRTVWPSPGCVSRCSCYG